MLAVLQDAVNCYQHHALARDERDELKESLEKPKKRSARGGRDW